MYTEPQMRRQSAVIFPILLFAATASAQFTRLASTGDGSRLFFSSPLRLRGTTQTFDAKIFRIDEQGPALFAARLRGERFGWTWTQFYDLTLPQVSRDSSVVAYTGVRACNGGSGCLNVQTAEGTVVDAAGNERLRGTGYVNLSRNGRYALFFGRNMWAGLVPPTELVDLGTGEHTTLSYRIAPNAQRRVADDGTVALVDAAGVRLWTRGREQVIPVTPTASAPNEGPLLMIANDAMRFVYQSAAGLARFDRTTGAEEIVTPGVPVSVSISDDAGTIAFVDRGDRQIYIGVPARVLTREPAGFSEVALSGDGRVAFGVTNQGRLVRIEIASGAITELVPRTPWITNPSLPGIATYLEDGIAPGSLVPLIGIGLSDRTATAEPPLPRELAGVRVRIGAVDAAIRAVAPDMVWLQVPWESTEQEQARFEFVSGNSPFETGPGTLKVTKIAPHAFATTDTTNGYSIGLTAVHENWSALVTPESPARWGEIIHTYFNGLGPVSPSVATGEAAPADPPARVTGQFTCTFWDGGPNVSEVLYAGLAPGMVGVYQVSLRVPAGIRVARPGVSCGFGTITAIGDVSVAQQ